MERMPQPWDYRYPREGCQDELKTDELRTDSGISFALQGRLGRVQVSGGGRAARSRYSQGQPSVKRRFRFHQLPKGE